MASYVDRVWEADPSAPGRRNRAGGHYRAYRPDELCSRPIVLTAELSRRCAEVEEMVRRLSVGSGASGLEHLARFLLRSEAIASSRIEGLQVSPQQVALVELEVLEGGLQWRATDNARLVARNMVAVQRATGELGQAPAVTTDDVVELQAALLDEKFRGLRVAANWIGGSDWHPLESQYVPPPPEDVRPLMDDLTEYLTGAAHSPLVQAGLCHAQFETIHPFADGNGRVGRALIHTALMRRGLVQSGVLPISPVLLTRGRDYIAGLTRFRHDGEAWQAEAIDAANAWLEIFIEAAAAAVLLAQRFADELNVLDTSWREQLTHHRRQQGKKATVRSDSVTARLLDALPELPVFTTGTIERAFDVSFNSARRGAEELADAGILARRKVSYGTTAYLASDIFELLTLAERSFASTAWDTRRSPNVRPVPARPKD